MVISLSEGYQVITGIVKVIRPSNSPVLGIADGAGSFLWLPEAEIRGSHPGQYENWQTTVFAVKSSYKPNWKPEKNWDQYKDSYPANTKPVPQPIPQMFLTQTVMPPRQAVMPIAPISQTAPVQQQQYQAPAQVPLQQAFKTTDRLVNEVFHGANQNDPLDKIANELESIRKLLEIYIKPPRFQTVDKMTEDQIIEQYGMPPYDNKMEEEVSSKFEPKVNKDDLPPIF